MVASIDEDHIEAVQKAGVDQEPIASGRQHNYVQAVTKDLARRGFRLTRIV